MARGRRAGRAGRRAGRAGVPGGPPGAQDAAPQPAAVTVEQRVREAVDTDVTGVRGIPGGGQVNVTQVVGRAQGGSVTGVANAGEGGSRSAPAPDGSGDA